MHLMHLQKYSSILEEKNYLIESIDLVLTKNNPIHYKANDGDGITDFFEFEHNNLQHPHQDNEKRNTTGIEQKKQKIKTI